MSSQYFFVALLFVSLVIAQGHGGSMENYSFKKLLRARGQSKSNSDQNRDIVTNDINTYSPVYVSAQYGLKEADKIVALPGQPAGVTIEQYSGYVTVDPQAGRALFYYFVESNDSSSKPLVLWLNGGPGCSSLGAGGFMELGPFRPNPDGKTLWENKYSWNNEANILFLESPAGVGFSYSNTTSDYDQSGDTRTAKDAYAFLVNWLERFPEYKDRDFFLTGESYAGHYVPQLAQLIQHNNKITNQTVINLKGIAIGNALLDDEAFSRGLYESLWRHNLISDEIHDNIVASCNFFDGQSSPTCDEYLGEADAAAGNIYTYDIYAPLCSSPPSSSPGVAYFDPCTGNYVSEYLNLPEVQEALHANVSGSLPGEWESCNNYIHAAWNDWPSTVLPVVEELIESGIGGYLSFIPFLSLYYNCSGDTDYIVPTTTTIFNIDKLNTTVKTPWYPWNYQNEVGGYVVEYEKVTFVTIRGAGHFVPSYQPARALTFFSSFLNGKLPPSE
ncbi:serine carboxypeptidase 1-like [Impatiens glandulifera]|uniref:serine carboxypeptidase 1-like n=1 Tax=Impatiens glandulifera TaxID=253017 RepID=UPI001FB0814D|nr:serine carboxypeptidase 1-like [Impatiens glandulifera]